ncbi:PAS domain S-box protein [Caulobacter sp.]|uniref:PAS domain S-box protein n=1 Tax=Caulobacter sp. TaxID=78 RepID=UPI0016166A7A
MGADDAAILDLVEDSIIVRDPQGRITAWNAVSERLYGWSRDQALGQITHDLLGSRHPLTIGEVERRLWADNAWAGEVTRCNAAGDEILVETRWRLRRDADGSPCDVVEIGRDLGGLSREVREARQTEHRYRNLFQAMAASFWDLDFTGVRRMLEDLFNSGVTDPRAYFAEHPQFIRAAIDSTRVVDVNDKTLEMYRVSREDLIGASIGPFWPAISQDVFAASLMAAIVNAPRFMAETVLARADGTLFDALLTVAWPTENKGKGTVLVGVIDISDRKAAEREVRASEDRYRNIFQATAVSFWELDFRAVRTDLDALVVAGVSDLPAHVRAHPEFLEQALERTTVVDVNAKTVELFAAGGAREALLGPAKPYWPPESRAVFVQALNANLNGQAHFEAETQLATLDGRRIDVIFTATVPADNAARGNILIGVVDISERVAAGRALERMQADLAHAARVSMLGELTASIAHEVNQPLAAITTHGEAGLRWLNRPEPDLDEARTATARMVSDARRAADIIARIQRMVARGGDDRVPIALAGLIEEATVFLGHEIQSRKASLTLDIAPDLPPVLGDRTQLQQVVVNLAMNALQAMASSSQRDLTIRAALDGSGRIAVIVEDSGPGVPEADLTRLFDSFFTTKPTGMGMGLSICRSIVESHGGAIGVRNLQDGGAVFSFTLPLDLRSD